MLAHKRLIMLQRRVDQWRIVAHPNVAKDHCGIARQPAPLRALHGRMLERRAEFFLTEREQFTCQRARRFPRKKITSAKRSFGKLVTETDVPRGHILGEVSGNPF